LESSKADVESEAEVKQRSSREEEGKEGEEREEGGKEEGGAEAEEGEREGEGEGDKGEEDTLSKPTPSAVLIPVGVAESETESTAHDMGKEVDIGKVAEEPQGMEGDIGEVSDAEVEETLHVTSNEELPSLTEGKGMKALICVYFDAKDEVKEEPRTEEQITKTSSDNISYSSENNFNRDAGSEEAKTLPKEVDETRGKLIIVINHSQTLYDFRFRIDVIQENFSY
ncbi:unnamed protein product, partial [Hymenolepis diminuta]